MYHCELNIRIFSASAGLAAALENVRRRERFEYAFKTAGHVGAETLRGCDIAILDMPTTLSPDEMRSLCNRGARLVLCKEPEQEPGFWETARQSYDDIWPRPLDPQLAVFCFERLLDSVKLEKDLRLTENYLESAINSIPDLVWFKDVRGAHLKVNEAFCQAVGKKNSDIVGRGHYYIWDLKREEYEKGEYVCLETEEMVLRAKKTCLFDEKVKSKHGLRQFKTYKSPIFGEDGEPIGTVGIAHDVTDLENMGTEMEIILRSMPFSILVKGSDGCVINTNERFETFFGVKKEEIAGKNYGDWERGVLENPTEPNEKGIFEAYVGKQEGPRLLEIRKEPIYDIFLNLAGELYIYRDVTAERVMEAQILRNSNTDFLTGLCNRRYFYEYVGLNRGAKMVSLIYIDLDHFKVVNDTFGHQAGDEALVATAELLRLCFPGAFLTRLGGDEFLILIFGPCEVAQLERQVNRLLSEMEQRFQASEQYRILTASAGISQTNNPEMPIDTLMLQSDLALYQAKQSGRNRSCVYTPDLAMPENIQHS